MDFCRSIRKGVACSRRSDSRARAKKKASKRAGKKEGRLGKRVPSSSFPVSPRFFPLFRSLSFSLVLHYLNAWNRLGREKKRLRQEEIGGGGEGIKGWYC